MCDNTDGAIRPRQLVKDADGAGIISAVGTTLHLQLTRANGFEHNSFQETEHGCPVLLFPVTNLLCQN